ncbi:hypothetical protein SCARR_00164 [Pontiella sulfatireligans]|uniref:Uncharacterized protein n=1 Tax=Pontiella sulfatireligans TaxID=2750658 RepID=A0A6C2UE28_9BACT|nr:hypothetical protein SCARR_00164 [Pontiella sulfatireligans]
MQISPDCCNPLAEWNSTATIARSKRTGLRPPALTGAVAMELQLQIYRLRIIGWSVGIMELLAQILPMAHPWIIKMDYLPHRLIMGLIQNVWRFQDVSSMISSFEWILRGFCFDEFFLFGTFVPRGCGFWYPNFTICFGWVRSQRRFFLLMSLRRLRLACGSL